MNWYGCVAVATKSTCSDYINTSVYTCVGVTDRKQIIIPFKNNHLFLTGNS